MQLRKDLDELVECGFLSPASNEAVVSDIEKIIGISLPDDLRYLWRNFDIIDGPTFDWWHLIPASNCQFFRGIMREALEYACGAEDNIVDCAEIVGPVKPMYWNDKWIPLFASEHVMVCVDMDPDAGGSEGQVIFLTDDGENRVVRYQSVEETFRSILMSVASGLHHVVRDEGMPVRIDAAANQPLLFYPE